MLPLLARATAISAGFHLNVFDFEGAEALHLEARQLAQSLGFAPPVVSAGIDQSHTKGRPKYEALGFVTRAHALHGLGKTRDAIADARQAVVVARGTADPALLLLALDALLALDGNDEMAAEARVLTDRILSALPDETMRRRFTESEVVQRIRR